MLEKRNERTAFMGYSGKVEICGVNTPRFARKNENNRSSNLVVFRHFYQEKKTFRRILSNAEGRTVLVDGKIIVV